MERALIVSLHGLASMLPPKVKFNRGDGMEPKGGLVSGAPGGPEPLACVSEKLNNVESLGKSQGSSKVSEIAMSMMG